MNLVKNFRNLFLKPGREGPKPLQCPICGNSPSLEYGDDIVCDKCSVEGKAVRAPRIWYLGHEDAGIRAWNRWVRRFKADGRSSVCGEVFLNLFQWYELGYDGKEMTENDPWYSAEGDVNREYREKCDLRRKNYGRITGPCCREDEKLTAVFGESSLEFENPGFACRMREKLSSCFRRGR